MSHVDVTVFVDHSGQKLKVYDLRYAVKIIANQPTERIEFSDNYNCYNVFFTAPEVHMYICVFMHEIWNCI